MLVTQTARASSEPKRSSVKSARAGHVTHGDILDDLGFSPKKAASLKPKADLHRKLVKRADQYSQQELQSILSETQSRVSQLLHGKISGFTLDMLIFYAERLGIHTEIKIKESRKPAHMNLVAAAKRRRQRFTWTSKKKSAPRFKLAAMAGR